MKKFLALAVFATALASSATQVHALSGPSIASKLPKATKMKVGRRVTAPIAHIVHCANYKAQCRGGGRSQPVELTTERWRQLQAVNANVNRSMRATTDQALHGRAEVWSLAKKQGDCEDYAIVKRHELIRSGWSASHVLLAVARNTNGVGHAVAVVRTNKGDYILDNLTDRIRSWRQTGYTWIKRQSATNPRHWVDLGGA